VTKRESGVSSGIFVRRNYRAAKKVTVSIATKTNFVAQSPKKLRNVGTAPENIMKIWRIPSWVPSVTNINWLLKPPFRIAI
jgi:hypothetical protein